MLFPYMSSRSTTKSTTPSRKSTKPSRELAVSEFNDKITFIRKILIEAEKIAGQRDLFCRVIAQIVLTYGKNGILEVDPAFADDAKKVETIIIGGGKVEIVSRNPKEREEGK